MVSNTTSSIGAKVSFGAGLVAGAALVGVGVLTILKSEAVAAIGKAILGGVSSLGSQGLTGAFNFVGSLVVANPGVIIMGGVLTLATVLFLKIYGEKRREIQSLNESLKVFNEAQNELIEDMVLKRKALNGVKFQLTDSQEHAASQISALEAEIAKLKEEKAKFNEAVSTKDAKISSLEEAVKKLKKERGQIVEELVQEEFENAFTSTAIAIGTPIGPPPPLPPRKVHFKEDAVGAAPAAVTPQTPAASTPLRAKLKPINPKQQSEAEKFLKSKGQKFSDPQEIHKSKKFIQGCVDDELENKRTCKSDEEEKLINKRLENYHDVLLFLSQKKMELMKSFPGELSFALFHRREIAGLETPG